MTQIQPTQRQRKIIERQMETDRELMEDAVDCLVFRPAIDGEFEIDEMLAGDKGMFSFKPEQPMPGGDWVAVVDVGRLCMGSPVASGFRVRIPCPPPLGGPIRQYIRAGILQALKDSFVDSGTDLRCMTLAEEGVEETRINVKRRPNGFGK